MKRSPRTFPLFVLCAGVIACLGCSHAPGYPDPGADVSRPDKELDFHALYKQDCSGCHGDNGRDGAALPLNNPAYLAIAGVDNVRKATAKGVSGTLMPGFATNSGGMLTNQQVEAIVQGMLREWGNPSAVAHIELPPYASSTPGNAADGQKAYLAACSRCHGVDGLGIKAEGNGKPDNMNTSPYSIVESSYLALVSDQSMRSLIMAGHPEKSTPDWRSYISGPGARSLSAQEITDIVAWIASHRAPITQQNAVNRSSNPPTVAAKENQ